MALTPVATQIGTTFHLSSGAPATFDQSGCEALTYTKVGGVQTVSALGDGSEDGTVTDLEEGRVLHYNGAKDGGTIMVPYRFIAADAGQVIIRNNENSTGAFTAKITDSDGYVKYVVGVIGPVLDDERAPTPFKGQNMEFRTISGYLTVAP